MIRIGPFAIVGALLVGTLGYRRSLLPMPWYASLALTSVAAAMLGIAAAMLDRRVFRS